jgi:3'(2'), 5'-bisphosphate nucleotidase
MAYTKEKQVALEAALEAAKLCERVRANIPASLEKKDKSPVTVADYGSQSLICRAIAQTFPNDPIVGEEDAAELRQPEKKEFLDAITNYVREILPTATGKEITDWINLGNGHVGPRYWTLDPIDGTKGFLRQDQYAVALALIEGGEVKLGVLACPALPGENGEMGQLFLAVRGEGATVMPISGGDARSIHVSTSTAGEKFRFVESVEPSHGDEKRQQAVANAIGIHAPAKRVDSQAKYGIVATGEAALYLRLPSPETPDYREKIWDHAAGAIVVEEAGGKVTDMHGKPLNFRDHHKMLDNQGVVVSNGVIHEQVLQTLKD